MPLGPDEIARIAHLARLAVDAGDVARYTRDLDAILELVARMNAADTRGVEPMAHPLDMSQRLRPDEVSGEIHREAYQAIAPLTRDGLYLVPRVID